MEIFILIAACAAFYFIGYKVGVKKESKNSLTKEEKQGIQEVLNLLNYDGSKQK